MMRVEVRSWIICSKKKVRKSCMLVLDPRWSTLFKKEEKQGLLLDLNLWPHSHTLVLVPSYEWLWHRHMVQRLSNICFDQSRSQQHICIFFAPLASPLKRWKDRYIPGFGVSIMGKDWYLYVQVNPSWVFLGYDLPFSRFRVFLK